MTFLRNFMQKGKRGYSEEDLYGLDSYLLKLIINALNSFANQEKIGMPHNIYTKFKKMNNEEKFTDEILENAKKEWNNKIKETANHLNEYYKLIESSEKYDIDYIKKAEEHLHIGLLELEEEIKEGYLWW